MDEKRRGRKLDERKRRGDQSYHRVTVCARLRPPFANETRCTSIEANYVDSEVTLYSRDKMRVFSFDNVYGPSASQKEVYETIGRPMVEGLMEGINAWYVFDVL